MNFDFLTGWLVSSIVYTIYLITLRREYKQEAERHQRRENILLQRISELKYLLDKDSGDDSVELLEDKENEI